MQLVPCLAFVVCACVCLPAAPASFLVFEPGAGETSAVARSSQGFVAFDRDGALLLPGDGTPVRMRLTGAKRVAPELLDRQAGYSNYLTGQDPAKWRTRVPHFGKVRYRRVLPGIDVVYYGTGGKLEYDFIVAPGADAGAIEIGFEGAERVRTTKEGDLLIETASGSMRHLRPRVYQQVGGQKVEVAGAYRVKDSGAVQFALGRYDKSRELIVDPVVQFSQYVGRSGQDTSVAMALDSQGNAYIGGQTNSIEFATATAFQTVRNAESDAYVAKFAPSGQLTWVTYYGGSRPEAAMAIAADAGGNVYVTGFTYSPDLPVRNGVRTEPGGGDFDSFVAKINTGGDALVWATYLGGSASDWASGIAVDSTGGAWVTGWTTSPNLPVRGGWQGGYAGGGGDVFVVRIAPSGSTFTYATYFGAEGRDLAGGIAVDAAGSVYVTGGTTSTALPVARATQPRLGGAMDAFVFKLNPTRNELVLSTFLGGSGEDVGVKVAADESGNAYVTGYTQSANFPVTRGAAQTTVGGGYDIFVSKIEDGGIAYATLLGGSGDDWAGDIAVDAAGSAYIAGWTNSPNFPARNAAQTSYLGGDSTIASQKFDAVVARVSPTGDAFLYSTYMGGRGEDRAYGIAVDPANQVWITGTTTSTDLPFPRNESPKGEQGTTDAFVARLSPDNTVSLLSSQPSVLRITAPLGETTPVETTIGIRLTGADAPFSASPNAAWIQLSPATGSAPGNLTVNVNTTQLSAGESRAEISVTSGPATLTIPVIVNVVSGPIVTSINPASLAAGSADAAITLTGAGFTPASRVELNGTPVITTFVDAQTLRVTVPSVLLGAAGIIRVVVIGPEVRSRTYDLNVLSSAPAMAISGIVNGATWQSGAIAPGQIVVVGGSGFGTDPLVNSVTGAEGRLGTTVGETRVLFDGTPAPILWVKAGQVSVIVPSTVRGRTTANVAVEFRGRQSGSFQVPVQASAPGIFSSSGNGTGAAAALNQDGSANTTQNPADRGSVIVIYATGLGTMSPAIADGALVTGTDSRPDLPVTVRIGDVPAAIEYAGGVPGQVAGLLQLNVRIPSGVPAGEVPVVVAAGNFSSPVAGVTVSVR